MVGRVREAWKPVEGTRAGRFLTDTFRASRGLISSFRGDSITLRAGNLTFITITSLLPLIAVVLSLFHAFKQQQFEAMILRWAQEMLAPGQQADSETYVKEFFAKAGSITAGGLSFLVLLVSAGLLLRHLDASLNEIWAVRRRRPLLTSIGLYMALLLFGPTVMGISLTGTSLVRRMVLAINFPFASQLIFLGGALIAVAVLTAIYKLAPHAPVRWRSAAAGGIVAGIGWELARHGYGSIARFFFSANPVYGALGIAPLFLMWLYISWCLVLFGARLSYAVEHAAFRGVYLDQNTHPRSRELVAVKLAKLVTEAFMKSAPAPTSQLVAQKLSVPGQFVGDVVFQLEAAGLLVIGRKGELKPGRDPRLLSLADISTAVGGITVSKGLELEEGAAPDPFDRLFQGIDSVSVQKLKGISWASLVPEPPPS